MLSRLVHHVEKEVRYYRGMLAMHRERYREYRALLARARMAGDAKRIAEITDDLAAFRGELRRLRYKQRSAVARLDTLTHDRPFTNPPASDTPDLPAWQVDTRHLP